MTVARYTLAVDRRFKRDNEQQEVDFIPCVAFGRSGEFAEKYFCKGLKVLVTGRIQTGSYINREEQKVHTTEIIVEEQEFAESKAIREKQQKNDEVEQNASRIEENGFADIPDGIDEELPFN